MATSGVDLGSIARSGSGFRLSGTSSNLDTEKLVEALAEAKRIPAVRLESRISANEAKAKAYGELEGLLGKLRSSVAGLRSPPGFLGANDNLFERKETFYASDTTTPPSSLLSVAAANKALPGSFELVVERLASARKLASVSVADAGASLASTVGGGTPFSGRFTLGLAGGAPPATIEVTGGMNLYDLRSAVNATSATSGVTANVLQVADDDFRLVLSAKETGKEIVVAPGGGDDVLALTGISVDGGATFAHPIQAPQQALIRIDGVAVTRDTNRITDAIDGLAIDLFKADPATTVKVDVERSLGGVKEQIEGFVAAYNELRGFVDKHSAVDEAGKIAEDAVLFGDTTLRGVTQRLSGLVGAEVAGLPADAVKTLRGIGISLGEGNRLVIDDTRLEDALLTRLDEVRGVLEFRFTASSSELAVFGRTNALADHAFTVAITDADDDGRMESATIDGVAVDIDGDRLVGRQGTPYEGLELLWFGKGSTSIDVTATQGLADRLYNVAEQTLAADDGGLARAVADLQDRNKAYQAEIGRVDERVERFRKMMIERFAAMETQLTLANAMLQQVKAQAGAVGGDT